MRMVLRRITLVSVFVAVLAQGPVRALGATPLTQSEFNRLQYLSMNAADHLGERDFDAAGEMAKEGLALLKRSPETSHGRPAASIGRPMSSR